jgi:4-carboxymuconolactone decarboxylase
MDERYERGRERFLEVHDEKALRAVEGLGDLGRSIVEFVYGDIYLRPGLSLRDRELAAVATLVAFGRSSQIPQHLRAALKAGVTPDELRQCSHTSLLSACIPRFGRRPTRMVGRSEVTVRSEWLYRRSPGDTNDVVS